ncbi:MAG: YqiJ family protein [Myxococcota bacterium]|nr:YqiJ family protein [Myxococcota bacterium]
MLELLGAPQNQVFTVALLVMLGIAAVEGVGTVLWGGVSQFLDALLPDFDVDVDLDVDGDGHGGAEHQLAADAGLLTPVLSWLQIGRVPILVLLVIFLTAFALAGLGIQALLHGSLGIQLPGSLAWIPAVAVAIPSVRVFGGIVARILPKEETTAVSERTFVGRIATIVLGTARAGQPTQARLRDEHGRSHYVLVEPDLEGDEFAEGDAVLLVKPEGARFRVIAPPSSALVDSSPDR